MRAALAPARSAFASCEKLLRKRPARNTNFQKTSAFGNFLSPKLQPFTAAKISKQIRLFLFIHKLSTVFHRHIPGIFPLAEPIGSAAGALHRIPPSQLPDPPPGRRRPCLPYASKRENESKRKAARKSVSPSGAERKDRNSPASPKFDSSELVRRRVHKPIPLPGTAVSRGISPPYASFSSPNPC